MTKVLRSAMRIARISGNSHITGDDLKHAWAEHMTGKMPIFSRVGG